jgi:hypothetical protein
VTQNFLCTGAVQTWTVPPGVTEARFQVTGAQGGSVPLPAPFVNRTGLGTVDAIGARSGDDPDSANGGLGGQVTATLTITPGSAVTIMVGCRGGDGPPECDSSALVRGGAGGFNGGGTGGSAGCPGAGGGGASDVRIGGTDLAHRVLVAGGGGGAAKLLYSGCVPNGGDGGGRDGETDWCGGGAGGTQDGKRGSGRLGQGSDGATNGDGGTCPPGFGGGGGGGGYYGGAGGGPLCTSGTGGGGGSGFGPPDSISTPGVQNGDGAVTVTYTPVSRPALTSLSPNQGPAAGGTVVTISGSGFSTTPGATSVAFGSARASSVSCSSSTQCTATSPPGMGTVGVRVTVGGQTSADTPAGSFTYLPFAPAPRTRTSMPAPAAAPAVPPPASAGRGG